MTGVLKVSRYLVPVVFIGACQNTKPRTAFDYPVDVGVAVQTGTAAGVDIRNGTLAAGRTIVLVATDPAPATGEAEIAGRLDQSCIPGSQGTAGYSHYSLKMVRGELAENAPAFAIANFGGVPRVSDSGITADLDGDGQAESFRACTSTEGVHLTIWTGKPPEGRRRWHFYHYLGYDVSPNCTEGETKPDSP